jgi:hypothetical protein
VKLAAVGAAAVEAVVAAGAAVAAGAEVAAGAAVFAGAGAWVAVAGAQADKINANAMVITATFKIVLRIFFYSFLI